MNIYIYSPKVSPFPPKNSAKKMAFGGEKRQNMSKLSEAELIMPTCFQAGIRVEKKWRLTAKFKLTIDGKSKRGAM